MPFPNLTGTSIFGKLMQDFLGNAFNGLLARNRNLQQVLCQTMKIQMKYHIVKHFIRVCTVCINMYGKIHRNEKPRRLSTDRLLLYIFIYLFFCCSFHCFVSLFSVFIIVCLCLFSGFDHCVPLFFKCLVLCIFAF